MCDIFKLLNQKHELVGVVFHMWEIINSYILFVGNFQVKILLGMEEYIIPVLNKVLCHKDVFCA